MLPPNSRSIREIAEEKGISVGTLYNWRKAALAEGRPRPRIERLASGPANPNLLRNNNLLISTSHPPLQACAGAGHRFSPGAMTTAAPPHTLL